MVYIQSDKDRKLPHHFDAACAMYGAMDSALDFRLTSFEEVQSGKFNNLIKTNLFVGSVEFMREVFSKVEKTPKLPMNSDRHTTTMTLGEVRAGVAAGNRLFIKPFQQKLFSGQVVDKYFISSLREHPDDLEVMVCSVIDDIVTEWRVYIMNGKIVDSRNYSGDFKISPNYNFVELKVKEYRHIMPIAYTMDVGVFSKYNSGCTTLTSFIVEFNDMYAIGNYGMPNDLYLRLLRERYFEIMKS
jgi:hypothetical protein